MNPFTENVGSSFLSQLKIDGGAGSNEARYSYSNNGSNTFAIAPVFIGMALS